VPRIVEREVTFDMHPEQAALYDTYRQQIRAAGRNARGDDHAFSVMWRMRKLTADPALVDLDCRNPRFDAIATEALRVRAQGGKTLVFLSIGEKEGAYTRLRDTLIRAGYPESEIEIVTAKSHGSSVARQNLEDNYNYGHLTLLICSDVVAEGFNLQHGTRAILHGDIPWNYEGIRQRNGRGGRQGNTAEHVESIYLLQRGSFDTITYTIVRGKKGWQDQLDGKTDTAENTAAEFSADEIARTEHQVTYRLYGSLFFGAVAKIDPLITAAEQGAPGVNVMLDATHLIALDTTGLDVLEQLQAALAKRGAHLGMVGLNPQPLSLIRRSGFAEHLHPCQ